MSITIKLQRYVKVRHKCRSAGAVPTAIYTAVDFLLFDLNDWAKVA